MKKKIVVFALAASVAVAIGCAAGMCWMYQAVRAYERKNNVSVLSPLNENREQNNSRQRKENENTVRTKIADESAKMKYTVREGDDIVSIAIAFGVSPSQLMAANAISVDDSIRPGDVLTLPANARPVQSDPEGNAVLNDGNTEADTNTVAQISPQMKVLGVEYDGENHGVIAYATGVDGQPFAIGGGVGKEAGSYTVTVEAGSYNDNYALAETATFAWTITEKAAVENPETGVTEFTKEISVENAKAGVNMTTIFNNANNSLAENKEVSAKIGTSAIVFDKEAIAAIAGSNNATLTLDVTIVEDQAAIEDAKLNGAEAIIRVSLGEGVTFENGKAKVEFAFDKAAPKGMVGKVYYVDAEGKRTDMNAKFADGKVSFETNHFSDYIVVFEKAPGLSGGAIAGIVIGCVAALAIAAFLVYWFVIRKKKNGGSKEDTTAAQA